MPQASASMLNTEVHVSTIRKRLNNYGFVWKDYHKKAFFFFLQTEHATMA